MLERASVPEFHSTVNGRIIPYNRVETLQTCMKLFSMIPYSVTPSLLIVLVMVD